MPLANVKRLYRLALVMTQDHSLAGRLLLALPGMGDPRFDRAAIAMFVHDAGGAFGIDLAHPCDDISFHDMLDELGIDPGEAPECSVLHGGPVETGRGFVLHSPEWTAAGSLVVPPLGALTASPDILEAIAAGKGPRRWLFALGYSGWGPGQLDGEMQRHGWHAAEGRAAILFETPMERRWAATWRAEGIDPALLASETGRA